MSDFRYWGNCTNSTAEDIWALQESAQRVSWRTFKKAVPDARAMLEEMGAVWPETTNKQIEDSSFFAFNKGTFMGRPAYFIDWGRIEWIWVAPEENPRRVTLSKEQQEILLEAYRSGLSLRSVAEIVGTSANTVRRFLKSSGEPVRPPSVAASVASRPRRKLTPEQEEQLVESYRAGLTAAAVGERFGVSEVTAWSILKRRGASRPRRKLTPEQEEQLVESYRAGLTAAAVGERFGISEVTAWRILKRHGVKMRHRGEYERPELLLVAAYDSGMSLRAIGRELGVSAETVRRWLKKAGVPMRVGRKERVLLPGQERAAADAYESGASIDSIAARFGVSSNALRAALIRQGVERREPKRVSSAHEHIDEVVAAYDAGMSIRAIGKEIGVSHETVRRWLKDAGVERRAGPGRDRSFRRWLNEAGEERRVVSGRDRSLWDTAEENPSRSVIRGALGIASITAVLVGLGFAIRAARMRKRRDPGPGQTAAVGNSITANQNGFVSFLDRSLPHRSFANMGVVGEGAAAIARRLERNVVGRGFDEVIIEAGINDIGRRDALEYIPRQLAAMVRTAKAAGLKVVLTTLPPWQDQATRIMAINQRIKNEGRTWGADVIVDIHRPLADWRGGLRSDLIGDRMGLHPTRAGQELIGRAILESAYS